MAIYAFEGEAFAEYLRDWTTYSNPSLCSAPLEEERFGIFDLLSDVEVERPASRRVRRAAPARRARRGA